MNSHLLDGIVRRPLDHEPTTTDRIDAVLTHKIWGTLIFIATMAPGVFPGSFQSMGRVAVYFEAAAVIISLTLLGQLVD